MIATVLGLAPLGLASTVSAAGGTGARTEGLAAAGQEPASDEPKPVTGLHAPFDALLDIYVRDGFVYYRALKSDRARFDRYIASLDVPVATYDRWPREQKIAYWINAYNAFVLQTIINAYPIKGRATEYPSNSVRQIPGAFEKLTHRAVGRTLTLDEIEKTVLPELKEPRVLLALGRGAIGGGRLHSEAYTAELLETQLEKVAAECVTRQECVRIDSGAGSVSVSPLFSWREAQFVDGLGQADLTAYPGRSPIERAVLRLIQPHVLPGERQFLAKNEFKLSYHTFDWRLNDLTGGMPDRR